MTESYLNIIATFNFVLLAWLVVAINRVAKQLETKVEEKELNNCRTGCHSEQQEMWKRINRHSHTDQGDVVITGDQ